MKPLKEYLRLNDLSIYKLAKDSGMAQSTLSKAANRGSIDSTTIRVLKAIANSLNKPVGQVADELVKLENKNFPN